MKYIISALIIFIIYSGANATQISIGERISLDSKLLNQNRELLIYTPASYSLNESSKFPVLYMVDGDYNFHYVTGLIELLSSISSEIPEMIVVGISGKGTTTYRKQSKPPYEVKDKGSADKTLDFIKDELIPFINNNYKTNNYKVLSGHSMGGLFSTYAMLSMPDLFNAYIAISPSLWWEDEAIKKHAVKQFDDRQQLPANYFITLGNEEGMGVHGFVEVLQSKGPRSLSLNFKHFPNESHGSVGLPSYRWALQDLFKEFKLSDELFNDALDVENYHKLIMKKYNTAFQISSGLLRNTIYKYSKNEEKRFEIEGALLKYFPTQVNDYRNIEIEGLIGVGKLKEAEGILQRAISSDANGIQTLTNQSRLLQKQNKPKKALLQITKAIKFAKEKHIRQWLLNELIEQKELITH